MYYEQFVSMDTTNILECSMFLWLLSLVYLCICIPTQILENNDDVFSWTNSVWMKITLNFTQDFNLLYIQVKAWLKEICSVIVSLNNKQTKK
jgi:hypothetical protein